MPKFDIQGDDGSVYTLEAPDEKSAVAAWKKFNAPPDPADVVSDTTKSAGIGLAKGVIAIPGLPGDVERLGRMGIDWASRKLGNEDPGYSKNQFLPGSKDIQHGIEKFTGPFYEPKTPVGKYAERIGEFLPMGIAAGPGGLAQRALVQGVAPAITSEAAGQATQGTSLEPYARIAGAMLGPAAAGAGMRAITPLPYRPHGGENAAADIAEHARQVELMGENGVPLSAGQRTDSGPLRWFESAMGDMPGAGQGASELMKSQQDAFTRAALLHTGTDANRATTHAGGVIDQAFTRLGHNFNQLAARNQIGWTPQIDADLNGILANYQRMVPPSQQSAAVEHYINDLLQYGHTGAIPGDVYQAIRSRLGKDARSAGGGGAGGGDIQLRDALYGIQGALDDAMQASILARGNPADMALWQQTRGQYRNLLAIDDAVSGAGEATARGAVTPQKLREAIVMQGQRAYTRGDSDLGRLANAGIATMTPLPNSGTPGRTWAMNLPGAAMSLAAGGAATSTGSPLLTGFGLAAGPAAGRAIMSRPAQAYLGNQVLADEIRASSPTRSALVESMLQPSQVGDDFYIDENGALNINIKPKPRPK